MFVGVARSRAICEHADQQRELGILKRTYPNTQEIPTATFALATIPSYLDESNNVETSWQQSGLNFLPSFSVNWPNYI